MELDAQAVGPGGFEDAGRLLDREGDLLTEGIDGIGKPELDDGGDHLLADELHIAFAVVMKFRRDGMSAQVGGGDIDRTELVQFADHAKHLQFGALVEAIA